MTKAYQSGFTLVEIAIVLVIVGLILGGVLKGQELITSGKVRNAADQGSSIKAAIASFQGRYRALPGDYLAASADTNIPGTPGGGNGNGEINTGGERGRVWTHLTLAGFIPGNYSGANVGANWTCQTDRCPANVFDGTLVVDWGAEADGTAIDRNELYTGQFIPIGVLIEIDRKIDDGLPSSGTFRISGTHKANCETGGVYNIAGNPDATCGGVYRDL